MIPSTPLTRDSCFAVLAGSVLKYPLVYGLTMLGIVVVALIAGFPPKVDGDILNLAPSDDPAVRAMVDFRKQASGGGIIALSVPPGTDLDALSARLNELPTVKNTYHGLDGSTGLKIALLQFSADEIRNLAGEIEAFIDSGGFGLIDLPQPPSSSIPGLLRPLQALMPDMQRPPGPSLLLVMPTGTEQDVKFSERLLAGLEASVPAGTLISGYHAQNARDTRQIRKDIVTTSIVSLILIVTIVGIAIRHKAGMLVLLPPLLAANIITHSILQLTIGAINIYTSMGSAVLFGLGVDFGIHLVSRYREELGRGLEPERAVQSAWAKTGPPCFTAAITSAAAFLAFQIADFKGLSQLGLMLAIGIIVNLIVMLLFLPLVITRIRLIPVEIHGFAGFTKPRRFISVSFLLVASLLLGFSATNLGFEYDLGAIREKGKAWSEMTPEQKMSRQAGYPPVIVNVEDRAEGHRYFGQLVESSRLPHVRAVVSLESVLPNDQQERLDALQKLIRVANLPERQDLPTEWREALEKISVLDSELLTIENLPSGLSLLIGAEESQIMLLLEGNLHDLRESYRFSRELRPHTDKAVSGFLISASIYENLLRDLPRVAIFAMLAVLLILALDLRRFRLILFGALSLFLGLLWAAGSLALSGIKINIINVVALPMLLGIGIDVIVHLLHRLRQGDDVEKTLRTTGLAVFLSTVTTVIAFMSLSLADSRGLQSLGYVVLVGLTAIFVSAILLLSIVNPVPGKSAQPSK